MGGIDELDYTGRIVVLRRVSLSQGLFLGVYGVGISGVMPQLSSHDWIGIGRPHYLYIPLSFRDRPCVCLISKLARRSSLETVRMEYSGAILWR